MKWIKMLMIKIIEQYFILITIYSIIGWSIESIKSIPREKKFVNRGFLIGPYCPIYGVGAFFITVTLKKIYNPLIIFIASLLICGILEYVTSYLMELLFFTRWWDYSHKKIHINGRVCLEYLIYFGIAGVLIIYIINPFLFKYINIITNSWIHIISILLIINFIVDIKWSWDVAIDFKKINKNIKSDNTNEIKKIILKKFKRHNRLINAFPKIKEIIKFDK